MQNIVRTNGKINFPHSIRSLKGVIHEQVTKVFPNIPNGFVQVGSEKWLLPQAYADFAEKIYNFEARPDDVYICTFPRSGTTWTQEMIWLICNELDYKTALEIPQNERFPYLDLHLLLDQTLDLPAPIKKIAEPKYEELKAQTTRRFIKTHLPVQLMPQSVFDVGAKVIYVARNPKDVAVSYYHFHKIASTYGYTGDFETFVQYFVDDLITFGPFHNHILDGWSHRNDKNFHFMFYEDSKADLEETLGALGVFLEKPLKNEDLPKLMNHLRFENAKQNPAMNVKMHPSPSKNESFIRRGKVGGNPEITKEIAKKIDEWSEKCLKESGPKFKY